MELTKKSWKDVSLKDYKKIVEICNRELDSVLEKDIAVLAVLLGVTENELYNININDLKFLLKEMEWIKTEKYTISDKMKKIKNMKIDGVDYTVNLDINKFTVSQYMDFQNFWDKRNDYMGNLLATFIIPKGHRYNEGYDVIELADKLESVFNLDDWNSVCFFFLKNYMLSTKASILYSAWIMKKQIRKMKNPKQKQELTEMRKKLLQQIKLMD